jgi:hypothetical protein
VCIVSAVVLIGFLLYPLFWLYIIRDAYTSAKRINAGKSRPDRP